MIVAQYLEWAATAPAGMRAEAAGALARSYLYGDLEQDIRADIAVVLTWTLDDANLLVRCAVAEALAPSADAPHEIVLSLANDAADVAEPVLARSPVLSDLELIEFVAVGGRRAQLAIARRPTVSTELAAAIAEAAGPEACEALLRNPDACIGDTAAARIAQRHGGDGPVRDALLSRTDLPVEIRQTLMRSVADSLSAFVTGCGWLAPDRARRAADEACDRGVVALASSASDARPLVLHLAGRGEFSATLALRALLSGELRLFEASLSALSGQSPKRVAGFVRDFEGRGFAALYRQAGFPESALPAFRGALAAAREIGFSGARTGEAALSRRMVERAMTALDETAPEVASLRALLRRFSVEAAREDARRNRFEVEEALARQARIQAQIDLAAFEALLAETGDVSPEADPAAVEAPLTEAGDGSAAVDLAAFEALLADAGDDVPAVDHAASETLLAQDNGVPAAVDLDAFAALLADDGHQSPEIDLTAFESEIKATEVEIAKAA